MMVKLAKEEVERACELWIEGHRSDYHKYANTGPDYPMAIDPNMEIKCVFRQGFVECLVTEKPKPVKEVKPVVKTATM